jgi:hypothetical protein
MSQKQHYEVITDTTGAVNQEIAARAIKGWKPILMSTVNTPKGIMVTVILEIVTGS